MIENIKLEKGKYEWVLEDNYTSSVYRHGELWRDTTGDNFVMAMASKIISLENELESIYEVLDQLPVDVRELLNENNEI